MYSHFIHFVMQNRDTADEYLCWLAGYRACAFGSSTSFCEPVCTRLQATGFDFERIWMGRATKCEVPALQGYNKRKLWQEEVCPVKLFVRRKQLNLHIQYRNIFKHILKRKDFDVWFYYSLWIHIAMIYTILIYQFLLFIISAWCLN